MLRRGGRIDETARVMLRTQANGYWIIFPQGLRSGCVEDEAFFARRPFDMVNSPEALLTFERVAECWITILGGKTCTLLGLF